MAVTSIKAEFDGHSGARLAARIDLPAGAVRAYALFAHCFTCSKDILAAKRIAAELARAGIAVVRFDFTGLGASEGEFASTNFSTNVADLHSAVTYMRDNLEAPSILIGHSLGGAAVLAIAGDIPEVRAVATIGAPADTAHVLHNFGAALEDVERDGEAPVQLAGRSFNIRRQFLEDVREAVLVDRIATMRKALLVLHSPIDATVGIENAGTIFGAAKHPKSFISLDKADHLVSRAEDAAYAASMIAAWASRYLDAEIPQAENAVDAVRASETLQGKYQNVVQAGRHRLFADEPESVGGLDSGPSPYDLLSAALATCTAMTLRMYAGFKKLDLGRITVDVAHAKVHAADCEECTQSQKQAGGKIDRFERSIAIDGAVSDTLRDKIGEIADKCPVHRTLESGAKVTTRVRVEGS